MKSFYSVVAVIFLFLFSNSISLADDWMKTSDPPPGVVQFEIYTGRDGNVNIQIILSGSGGGLFKSTDDGTTWGNIGLSGTVLTSFYDNPDNTGEYVATASDGVYITTDGGTAWDLFNTGIEGLFNTDVIKLDASSPTGNNLCIGTVGQGVFTSSNGGQTWEQLGTGLENKTVTRLETFVLTSGPLPEVLLFATTQGEGVYKFDFPNNTWLPINDGIPSLLNNTAIASNDQGELFLTNFDFGICSSPNDPVFWTIDNSNFLFGNDIFCTQNGEAYFSSLGDGIIKRDANGNYSSFSSGIPEDPDGYRDVSNLAKELLDGLSYAYAAYTPLHPSMTPGIYRTVNPVSDVKDKTVVTPEDFRLEQNYPNPFNPSTTISYSIPNNSFVTIKIYDVLGNQIAELVNEEKSIGVHEVTFDASNLSTGTYFYQLQAIDPGSSSRQGFVETRKMILIK